MFGSGVTTFIYEQICYINMIKICQYCKKKIDTTHNKKTYGGHVGSCKFNPNRQKGLKIMKQKSLERSDRKDYKCVCKCGQEYTLNLTLNTYNKHKYKKHCSRKCANSKIQTEEINRKRRETILRKIKNGEYIPHPGKKGKQNPMYKETADARNRENKFKTFRKYKGICQMCEKKLDINNPKTWVAHHNKLLLTIKEYNSTEDRNLFCCSCHTSYHNKYFPKKRNLGILSIIK